MDKDRDNILCVISVCEHGSGDNVMLEFLNDSIIKEGLGYITKISGSGVGLALYKIFMYKEKRIRELKKEIQELKKEVKNV